MGNKRCHVTERILNHTLEIIYLLTGEGYTIMNESGGHVTPRSTCVLGGWNETKIPITVPLPNLLIHERSNDLKILELTNKIIHLLTGEVPIRCQDVSVYFSMEEWEYIEEHQDLYKDVIMGNHQTLPSVDGLKKKKNSKICTHHLYLNGCKEEDNYIQQDNQSKDLIDVKNEVLEVEVQKFVSRAQQCQEEKVPSYISAVENSTKNTLEKHFFSSSDCKIENRNIQNSSEAYAITVNVPLLIPGADISPDLCNDDGCFADKTDFVTQNRAHRVDKVFSCLECDKYFTKNSDLSRHQRTHSGEKPFSCSECGEHFTQKSGLIKHQRIHMSEKKFPCSECQKRFTQKSGLVNHQRIHTGEKPFPCFECGKWFTQKSTLLEHQRIHTGDKPFPCSDCGKCFTQKAGLIKHQRIHMGEKPFSCSDCAKCFARKYNLLAHQTIHTDKKPFPCKKSFPCSECGKCFTRKSVLVRHQRFHRGDKPFPCSECGKWFTQKSGLVKHQRTHRGPFICTECTKCFTYKTGLDRHKRIHSGEKPFSCSDCGRCFSHKSNLLRHQKIHSTTILVMS